MSADFTPEKEDYKILTPFKMQVLTNFPYIEADFDALTNYQLLCKIVEYLNNVITNENEVTEQVTSLYNAYVSLQNYVNDYFDNLDLQEEVDKKIDELVENGTLTNLIKDYVDPIYQAYENSINQTVSNQNTEISNFKDDINEEVDLIDSKVTAATSGAPLVASSTAGMTNTSKVYVNTSDGNWYYYNGTAWTVGGVYQATQISNGSIDLLKLDENLQNNFTYTSSDYLTPDDTDAGFTTISDNVVSITSSSGYETATYNLEINKTYIWNGFDSRYTRGLIIADTSNNVLYDSGISDVNVNRTSYIFSPKQANLKAMLCYSSKLTSNDSPYCRRIGGVLRELDDIASSYKINEDITLVDTVNDCYFSIDSTQISDYYNSIIYHSYSGIDAYIYSIEKGKKYTFVGNDWASVRGLIILDNGFNYLDGTSNQTTNITPVTKSFVAEEDGFAVCHDIQDNGYTFTCVIPGIDDVKESIINDLNIKQNNVGFSKWLAIGDSITEVNFRALHNYLYWIKQDIPHLTITNLGVSGTGYKRTSGGGNNTFIDRLSLIDSYDLDDTIITVMGSINDVTLVQQGYLGELGDTTTETIYGSIYTFFNTLFTNFNGVRVGCISPINWKNSEDNNALDLYCKALEDTCKLFHVPYIDMRYITNLRPNNTTFLNEYYEADGTGSNSEIDTTGVHPNSKGHRLMYGRIKDFIARL